MKKEIKKANTINQSYDINEILRYAIDNGIISLDTMLNDMEAMERKEILAKHKYTITTMTDKKGKTVYSTYLPDSNGKRLFRRRNTLKELEDTIVEFYRSQQEDMTLDKVFDEWIERKLQLGDIQKATYDKYKDDYERFFHSKKYSIIDKKFKNISEDDLEVFIKSVIRDLSLSHKAYSNMRILIQGMFKYGKKQKYTDISISHFFGDLELSKNMFKTKKVEKEKEVFLEEEIPMVLDYLSVIRQIKRGSILQIK